MDFSKYENNPAINLWWKDKNRRNAGGELVVIEATLENEKSRAIVENAAICVEELYRLIAISNSDPPEDQMLNSICWQALRDMKTSLFLSLSGRYRSAAIIQRGVIELIGSGVYFTQEVKENERAGWKQVSKWMNGEKDASPSFKKIKAALSDLIPWLSEAIYTSLAEDREFQNQYVHTPYGDNTYDVLFNPHDDGLLIRPWATHHNLEKLKPWYVSFLTDCFYMASVIAEYWKDTRTSIKLISNLLQFYEDLVGDDVIRGQLTDIEVKIK